MGGWMRLGRGGAVRSRLPQKVSHRIHARDPAQFSNMGPLVREEEALLGSAVHSLLVVPIPRPPHCWLSSLCDAHCALGQNHPELPHGRGKQAGQVSVV